MWLLVVSVVGFVFGNGLFAYWFLYEFEGWAAVASNHLAMAFIIDAFLTLFVLAVRFARQPGGRVAWPWFVVLAVFGGLCFGLPFYLWLNERPGASTGTISA
jgi:hypothetical protein